MNMFRRSESVLDKLWNVYADTVLPLERQSHFQHFHSPSLKREEFEAKPQVLLVGQYSTGKTTIVKWLTGCESTHFDVAAGPSTDKFMAVVHGLDEHLIDGHAASVMPQLPYKGLDTLGQAFLESFRALALPSDLLADITFVDTPGVLAGAQDKPRDYDYNAAMCWLAERADLVLLTFDAHKVDISGEMRLVMEVLRPFSSKVRLVFNKADQLDAKDLLQVYGSLMWNVGQVMQKPETPKVFVGSFRAEQYRVAEQQKMFDEHKDHLVKEIKDLARSAMRRKVNVLVSRIRKVKAHYLLMARLRSQLPSGLFKYLWSTTSKAELLQKLPALLQETRQSHALPPGDLPDAAGLERGLHSFRDLEELPAMDKAAVARLQHALDVVLPQLAHDVSGGVSGTPRAKL